MCGSCLDKCISVALGPPKQKFLAPPLPACTTILDFKRLKKMVTRCLNLNGQNANGGMEFEQAHRSNSQHITLYIPVVHPRSEN